MRVAHYVNQFFGGIGAEEHAGKGLEIRDGAAGPESGLPVAQRLPHVIHDHADRGRTGPGNGLALRAQDRVTEEADAVYRHRTEAFPRGLPGVQTTSYWANMGAWSDPGQNNRDVSNR